MDDTPARTPLALGNIMTDSAALGFAMSCDARTGSLLATLAACKPGGRLLELGTGTGAGSAWLLDGMSWDATLTTVEIDPALQGVARLHLGGDPRVRFEIDDAHTWLCSYDGEPFDLVFVDCRPGTFHGLVTLVGLLRVGGLYVTDDLPEVARLRAVTMAWSSGLVVGARI